ncbi:MAG: hypothetical protein ACRDOH_32470 [Streptosporangiaceae bacterium]
MTRQLRPPHAASPRAAGQPGPGELDRAAETLDGLTTAALEGGLDGTASLVSLSAARRLAAELDRVELALIEAARDSGATWGQVAAAMGASNRQTAQKRHADLARRHPRPPTVDIPRPAPQPGEDSTSRTPHDPAPSVRDCQKTAIYPQQEATSGPTPSVPGAGRDGAGRDGAPGITRDPAPPARRETKSAVKVPRDRSDSRPAPAAPGTGRRQVTPRITSQIIVEGRYQLVKAPDHAETRTWHVLVSGKKAGMVRPTWRGERSKPGWESIDNTGLALPATSIGRTTAAGNARTRDAAAVSLLQALLRQQEHERTSAAH